MTELEAQKKTIKEAAAVEVAAIRKATAEKVAALKAPERRLRALDEAYKQAKEAAVVPEVKQEQVIEKSPEKAQEQEKAIEIEHHRGFGIGM